MSEQFVMFRSGEESYGLNMGYVLEIIKQPKLTAVPLAHPHVSGIINLRDDIVTVIELHEILGGNHYAETKDTRVIVIEAQDQKAGLIVDDVVGVLMLSDDDIQDPPKVAGVRSEMVEGIAKHEDQLLTLLNLESFIADYTDNVKSVASV